MAKLYILALAGLLAAAPSFAARKNAPAMLLKKQHTELSQSSNLNGNKKQLRRAAPAEQGTWVAKKFTISAPDVDGNWFAVYEYSTDYNENGLPVRDVQKALEDFVDENTYQVTTIEYNEYGNYTQQCVQVGDELDKLTNSQKTERKYDERMHNLITQGWFYSWSADSWQMNSTSYVREVTRDAAGNVTQVLYKTLYQGEFTPVQRVDISYADGKADIVTEFQLAYDDNMQEYWKEGFSLRNCKWACTDGQISSIDYVFEGANKIASCVQYSEGELVGEMSVVYVGEDFVSTLRLPDGSESGQTWTDLENGGYQTVITYKEFENGEEAFVMEEVQREEIDIFGNIVFACDVVYYDGLPEVYQWEKAESTYNENGCPTSIVFRAFYAEEEPYYSGVRKAASDLDTDTPPAEGIWEDMLKFDYTDFEMVGSGSVGNIISDENATPEYYTIEGCKVAEPGTGLYIVRKNGTTRKVYIR